ncbi:hypothetical protein [Streptomyces sclerotialus]|uniref:hypothetical protein n=1 Tax=Streptomyces sclerotialus TaxID=1957 RepID=UPI0034A12405
MDFGNGTVQLPDVNRSRPVNEKVHDEARAATAGRPDRQESHWRVRLADRPQTRGTATSLRSAVHQDSDGRATGYALYRHRSVPDAHGGDSTGVMQVLELAALSLQSYAALWHFLAGIDLAAWIEYEGAADEPLPHLLAEPRTVHSTLTDRL